jgi:hypothetical protein
VIVLHAETMIIERDYNVPAKKDSIIFIFRQEIPQYVKVS